MPSAKEEISLFDFERPNIEVAEISEDHQYGKFVVEPLERGYCREQPSVKLKLKEFFTSSHPSPV